MLNRSPTATAHFSYSDPKPIEISSVSIVNILCRVNWDLVFANLPTPSFSLKFLFFHLKISIKQFIVSKRH